MPADMAIEVMTMGRARLWPASTIASKRSMPRCIISIAKSTSRIAFLVTMPISIRMPISTGIDTALLRQDQRRRHAADGQRQREQDGEGLDDVAEQQDQHRQHQHQAQQHRVAEALRPVPAWTSASPVSCTRTRRRQFDAVRRSR